MDPLPVDFPLLLINLSEITSDIDSVLERPLEEPGDTHSSLLDRRVSTVGETSEGIVTEGDVRNSEGRDHRIAWGDKNTRSYLGSGTRTETGNKIVVNLSKRELAEAEISLLSKGLKFCPTSEKIGVQLKKGYKGVYQTAQIERVFLF